MLEWKQLSDQKRLLIKVGGKMQLQTHRQLMQSLSQIAQKATAKQTILIQLLWAVGLGNDK